MRKYIIMGPQGSGKGTQAKRLHERFDLVHISVGDIFRWHIQAHTKLGARVKRIVSDGQLVPDEIVQEIVQDRLAQHDWNYGFLLDGFPRNSEQARFFLESYDIDAVVRLMIPDEVVLQRTLGRRVCDNCGLDYNLFFHRPEVGGVCDVCGGPLVSRSDDHEEAIKRRLADYRQQTEPTLNLFRRKNLIVDVDGTLPSDTIHAQLIETLGLTP